MKFYNLKLRLAGALHHEVRLQNISAAEVTLLDAIHGTGSVSELMLSGEKEYTPRDHRVERRRLEVKYGQDWNKEKHLVIIRDLFGVSASRLPESVTLDDLAPIEPEEDDMDGPLEDAPVVRRVDPTPKQATLDAKDAVKSSIRALGGMVPSGNLSLARLQEHLGQLQIEAARASGNVLPEEPDPQQASATTSVLEG